MTDKHRVVRHHSQNHPRTWAKLRENFELTFPRVLLAAGLSASSTQAGFDTANDLLASCQSNQSGERAYCVGYYLRHYFRAERSKSPRW
jgi:hypothetical protein